MTNAPLNIVFFYANLVRRRILDQGEHQIQRQRVRDVMMEQMNDPDSHQQKQQHNLNHQVQMDSKKERRMRGV